MVNEDTYDREGEEDEEGDGVEFEEAFCLEDYGYGDVDDACQIHKPEREAPVNELRDFKWIVQQF